MTFCLAGGPVTGPPLIHLHDYTQELGLPHSAAPELRLLKNIVFKEKILPAESHRLSSPAGATPGSATRSEIVVSTMHYA